MDNSILVQKESSTASAAEDLRIRVEAVAGARQSQGVQVAILFAGRRSAAISVECVTSCCARGTLTPRTSAAKSAAREDIATLTAELTEASSRSGNFFTDQKILPNQQLGTNPSFASAFRCVNSR
jgi:hypothetical protein